MELLPQESLAGTDRESNKRDSPLLEQTVLRVGSKQDQLPIPTGEVTTPLTQFYSEYNGDFSYYSKTKSKDHTDQNVYTANAHSGQIFYLPDGKRIKAEWGTSN